MYFLTEALVSAAKTSEFFPTGQGTFSDPDDLISFANQEMQIKLVPVIMSVRQDFFSAEVYTSLRNTLNHYAMPERAIGNSFQDLFYVPDASTIQSKLTRYPLSKLHVHDAVTSGNSSGAPSGFYLRGDEVVLNCLPAGLTGVESLMWSVYRRPNRLVPTSYCAKITGSSVVGSTTVFTVDTDLTSAGSSGLPLSASSKVDILSMTSPFRAYTIDSVVQAVSSSTITVLTADVQDESATTMPQVGDMICPAQTANVPMIPQEMHPILSEMIAFRCNKALGNQAGMAACAQNIKDMLAGALKLIENRVDAEPDVVFDPQGFLGLTRGFGHPMATR